MSGKSQSKQRLFLEPASDWKFESSKTWGPFVTQTTWLLPDGKRVTWTSRAARKRRISFLRPHDPNDPRQLVENGSPCDKAPISIPSPEAHSRQQVLMNAVASVAFIVGGLLFAFGAAMSEFGSSDMAANAVFVYFCGGLFFNTGGYTSLLQAINAPTGLDRNATPTYRKWRWWSYEPHRIDWLSSFALFAGTIVFGVNLLDSFIADLTSRQENLLVWAPDMIGCALFLISGHLALGEVCHRRFCFLPRRIDWVIAVLNQIGSYLFLISALGAFIDPRTSDSISTGIANIGTLFGALCFALGGCCQLFERPGRQP